MKERKVKQFDNGLTLVYKYNKHKEAIYCEFRFRSGLINDPQDKLGLAHFVEHAVAFSNSKYTKQEKNDYRMRLYYANFATSRDSMRFYTYVSDEEFEEVFAHYVNSLTDIIVPQDEFDNEKKVINQEILKFRKNLNYEMTYSVHEHLYYEPLSYRIRPFGLTETVANISKQDILDYAKQCFVLSNCQLTIYGNISYAKVKRLLKKYVFSAFPQTTNVTYIKNHDYIKYSGNKPTIKISASPDEGKSRVRVLHRAQTEDIDRFRNFATAILCVIFETAAHEFFRDKYGLCYASSFRFGNCTALNRTSDMLEAMINIDCDQTNVKSVIDHLPEFYEFLQNYKIDEHSVEKAKTTLRRYEKCTTAKSFIHYGEAMADKVFDDAIHYTYRQNQKYKKQKEKISVDYVKQVFNQIIKSAPHIFVVSNTDEKLDSYEDVAMQINNSLKWVE